MRQKPKPDKAQLKIDWNRGLRKALIANLILPGLTVRQSKRIIDFLKAVEEFARDGEARWLKASTVAKGMKVSERTVFRAIDDCVEWKLLRYEGCQDKLSASRYEIDWGTIKQMIVDNPKTIALLVPHEARKAAAPVVETNEPSVDKPVEKQQFTPDTVSGSYDTKVFTPDTVSGSYDTVSAESEGDTTYRACAVLNHELNHVREPEIEPCSSSVLDNIEFTAETQNGGWGRRLQLHDFQNRDAVERLWLHALKFRFVPDPSYRVRFFTLAKYVSRMTVEKKVRNPGAYFTAQVIGRNWLGDAADTRAAINAITMLDGRYGRK